MREYPCLEIDLHKIRENLSMLSALCEKHGITPYGVVKCVNALGPVVQLFAESPCAVLGSSRLSQLVSMREQGVQKPLLLIRSPMLSEIADVARYADICLHSGMETIAAMEKEAEKLGVTRGVLLAVELGDLRDGFWNRNELVEAAVFAENSPHLTLEGVSVNLGCYGTILATPQKMEELIEAARLIEARIGRKLAVVSGGASSSVQMLLDDTMPEGINNLRLGEIFLIGWTNPGEPFGCEPEFLHKRTFRMQAEVIEVHRKPSVPVGEKTVNAFGQAVEFEDRGEHTRAVLAAGRLDFGDWEGLEPTMEGAKILGASSDHMIVDVEDCAVKPKVGDIMEFTGIWSNFLRLTAARDVRIAYKDGE